MCALPSNPSGPDAAVDVEAVADPAPLFERRVLVVEDDVKLAHLIVGALERGGIPATHTGTGDGALAALLRAPWPAGVIVDVMIPHPDGIELCAYLRRNGWSGAIVVTSARDSSTARRSARDAGADAFLAKPMHMAELVELTSRLVDERCPASCR